MIEKSVHDLDVALVFMEALGVEPKDVDIATKQDNRWIVVNNS